MVKWEVAFCHTKCGSSILDKRKDVPVWPGVEMCVHPAEFLCQREQGSFPEHCWQSCVLLIGTDPPSLKYLDLSPQSKGASNPCPQASFCKCWEIWARRMQPSLECLLLGRRALGTWGKSSEEGGVPSFSLLGHAARGTFSWTRAGSRPPAGEAQSLNHWPPTEDHDFFNNTHLSGKWTH